MTRIEEDILYKKIKELNKKQTEFFNKTKCKLEIIEDYNKSELLDEYGKEYLTKTINEFRQNEQYKNYKITKYYILKREDATSILMFFDVTEAIAIMAEIAFGEFDGVSDYHIINYLRVHKKYCEESNTSIVIKGINMNNKIVVKQIQIMDKINLYNLTLGLLKTVKEEHKKDKIDMNKIDFDAMYFEIRDFEKEPNIWHIPASDEYLDTTSKEATNIFSYFKSEEEFKEFFFRKAKEEKELKNGRKFTEEENKMINDGLDKMDKYMNEDEKENIIMN